MFEIKGDVLDKMIEAKISDAQVVFCKIEAQLLDYPCNISKDYCYFSCRKNMYNPINALRLLIVFSSEKLPGEEFF